MASDHESLNPPPAPQTVRTARRSRKWLWVFGAYVILTIVALVVLCLATRRRELSAESLARARELWDKADVRDYDLTYTKRIGLDGKTEKFFVSVRDGKVVAVTFNEKQKEPEKRFRYYGMPRMFEEIEEDVENDKKAGGPAVFAVADFDAKDGHLLRYVRSVGATGQRVELIVTEFQVYSK